ERRGEAAIAFSTSPFLPFAPSLLRMTLLFNSDNQIARSHKAESFSCESLDDLRVGPERLDVSLQFFDLDRQRPDFFGGRLIAVQRKREFSTAPQVKLDAQG